jgi:hypothetical protein
MQLKIAIDLRSVARKTTEAAKVKGAPVAYMRAYSVFKRAKGAMLREYDRHPISVEIKGGVGASPSSGATQGYGNLFTFLGFEKGSDPVGQLRHMLDAGTGFRPTIFRDNTWYFRVSTPSREVIGFTTNLAWGMSWVEAVEEGVDNLSYYVYKTSRGYKGRSGGGFQKGKEHNPTLDFKPSPYLSEILDNFRDRINNSSLNDAI